MVDVSLRLIEKMSFWVYMVQCKDGSYYIGHTEDIELRLAQHNNGYFKGYTSSRLPIKLVWSDEFPTREEALDREKQIKGWSRAKKEALIRGDWNEIKALSKSKPRKSASSIHPSTGSGRTDSNYFIS